MKAIVTNKGDDPTSIDEHNAEDKASGNINKMFKQRQRVINKEAITVNAWQFRQEMNVYLTCASVGNPVIIRFANGQKIILSAF